MKKISRWILAILFLSFLLTGYCSAQQNARQPFSEAAWQVIHAFEAQIQKDVAADSIGSITIAVVKGNAVIEAKSFAWADREQQVAATPEHIYRIGSISKSMTAVLMMQLVENGVLQLDESVEKYFPEIKNLDGYENYPSITFRQLASHTAGLIREPKLPNAAAGPIAEWENKILQSIPRTSFFAAPGEKYQYSNIGYGILGLAISRPAGEPFMDLMHEMMFVPLEMHSTTFIIDGDLEKRLTTGYANRGDSVNTEFPAKEHAGRGYKVPNGGVYTTVGDLAKFIAAMTGAAEAPILSEASRAEMQRIQTPDSDSTGYGLGFFIEISEDGIKTVGHSGSVAGYNVYHAFAPQSQIGVILFRNYNSGATNLRRAGNEFLLELERSERAKSH